MQTARADELGEWIAWGTVGDATGLAAQSYADYVRERQLLSANIAAAKAELERCGGCAEAQAELDKWQGVENELHETVGSVFQSVGMPPIVAQALGINLPVAPRRSPREWEQMCEIIRRDWIDQRPDFCRAAADQHLACLREFQRANGVCSWKRAEAPGAQCWDTKKLSRYCYSEDCTNPSSARRKFRKRGPLVLLFQSTHKIYYRDCFVWSGARRIRA